MKAHFLLQFVILFSFSALAQKQAGPVHGMVYGAKPDTTGIMPASQVEDFMAKKTRISVAIRAKVLKVTKEKGGWFEIDAGKGRVISAHFTNYDTNIPATLAGRMVKIDGIAQKQFIADDQQHFAGDTVNGKKQSQVNADPKRRLTFEVKGMMVD